MKCITKCFLAGGKVRKLPVCWFTKHEKSTNKSLVTLCVI